MNRIAKKIFIGKLTANEYLEKLGTAIDTENTPLISPITEHDGEETAFLFRSIFEKMDILIRNMGTLFSSRIPMNFTIIDFDEDGSLNVYRYKNVFFNYMGGNTFMLISDSPEYPIMDSYEFDACDIYSDDLEYHNHLAEEQLVYYAPNVIPSSVTNEPYNSDLSFRVKDSVIKRFTGQMDKMGREINTSEWSNVHYINMPIF